jgi:hypothetical protein
MAAISEACVVDRPRGAGAFLARIGLGAVTLLLSINLWTGFPLAALWIGSRAAGGSIHSMGGIGMVLLVLAVLMVGGVFVLGWLSRLYDRVTGRPIAPAKQPPWLQSMRSSRVESERVRLETNAVERIVIFAVVCAVIALEVWYFFFAGPALVGG